MSRSIWLLFVSVSLLFGDFALAQRKEAKRDPVEKAALEHAIDADAVTALVGQECTLLLSTGKKADKVKIKKFLTGKELDKFRTVEVVHDGEKKVRKYPGDRIYQMEFADITLKLNFLPSQKMYVLEDVAKRTEAIKTQLEMEGYNFWGKLDEEAMQAHVDKEKEFLKEVGAHFSSLPMQLLETEYFLFFTDMPLNQVAPYVKHLDKMNEALGQAFGFAPGENVWRGKAVVIAFIQKEAFQEFEKKFMDNAFVPDNVQGLCHQDSEGRVITSCVRGGSETYFGAVIVHETAHGYMHRYYSTARIPSWLNEGIAEWIASQSIPSEGEMRRRQGEAQEMLRTSKNLGSFYEAPTLERWQYGAAHSIVESLIKHNPHQFRLFFNGIKEGLIWEDSLDRAYGMTRDNLTAAYGRSIGVPDLRETR